MISEHTFASHFPSFWRTSLPNLESVLRTLNLGYERLARPLRPSTAAFRRDIISETGFRLFGLTLSRKSAPEDLVDEAHEEAATFLERKRRGLSGDEAAEALELRRRLAEYANSRGGWIEFMPSFQGHGMLAACFGDLVVNNELIEVKYVDRSFRSTDLRQLLCYSALRYFSEGETYEELALVNPLRGVATRIGLTELIDGASGRSAPDFFQEMSYALSSGEISR